jgi:hypothetical protein
VTRIRGHLADPEAHGDRILAVDEHGRLVQRRVLGRPEAGVRHREAVAHDAALAGGERDRGVVAVRDGSFTGDPRRHAHRAGDAVGVADGRAHLDDRHVVVDALRLDDHAVRYDVHGAQHVQRDRAVQARAGVPARVLTRAGLDAQRARRAVAQIRRQLEEEPGVTVGTVADELVVDEHLRAAEDALQLENDGAIAPLVGHVELAQVGERAARIVGLCAAPRGVGRACDIAQGVVRKAHRFCGELAADRGERPAGPADPPAVGEGHTRHERLLC